MNVNEDNCQSEVKKSNSKTAVITSASEPVRVPVSAHMLKQAAVANQIAEKIADQKICDFTYQKLFTMVSDLKRTFI